MNKLLTTLALAGLALGIFLGWRWVSQVPSPGKNMPASRSLNTENTGTPNEPTASSRPSIRIALIATSIQAGPNRGTDMATPTRFCVDRINARGGIRSLPIELMVLESENTPVDSANAARQALEYGAIAVLSGYTTTVAMASAEVLQKAHVPMIAVGSTNPDVTRTGDFIFHTNFDDSFQGAAMAEFAHDSLGARKTGILVNVGNSYSPYLAEVYAEQFKQRAGQVLWRKEYLPTQSGTGKQISDFPASDPDVIYVPGYEEESAVLVLAARSAGLKATFLGVDGWGPSLADYVGDAVIGSFYTRAWHPDARLVTGLQDVLEAWIEKHGPIRRDITALTLDSCHLLLSALERAEKLTPEDVREELAGTKGFNGIVGSYSFDSERKPAKPLTVVKLEREGPVLVKVVHPKTVKLGYVMAKTGEACTANVVGWEAARYAVDEINRLGGAMGHSIELIEYDNESTELGSVRAATQAAKDGVSAVVGATWSSFSLAMAPVLQSARVPMITPNSTNPDVTRHGNFIFRAGYTDELQGKLLAEFALNDLGARKAVILINSSSLYSVDLGRFIKDRFGIDGVMVSEQDYLQSWTDFSPMLEKVKAANPDVIFLPSYQRDSLYIIKQARQMGIRTTFIGPDAWSDFMYQHAEGELEGCFYSQHWYPDLPNEKSRAFVERYSKTHRQYSEALIALTYDTFHLIADAIRRARSVKPEDVREALAHTDDFHGVTGKIEFDANGDPYRKPMVILRFGKERSAFYKMAN